MTVNVGIIGVGNCASSLLQGVAYYTQSESRIGLRNPTCAGYSLSDLRFTSAFDVDVRKIGRDLAEAITSPPNNALVFAEALPTGVTVADGMLADGLSDRAALHVEARGKATLEQVVARLRESETRVLVNFLPVGSQAASELYARAALLAGCAFINCMPATIARSRVWAQRFAEAGLPLLGDDLKSQFGATLLHHALLDLLTRSGVLVRHTYQLVSGGNMDFVAMQDPERVQSKAASKLEGMHGGSDSQHVESAFGATFVSFLRDRKVGFIRIEGEAFGGTPLALELRMEVEDSPSAAGNVLDAVRYCGAALERGLGGVLEPVCSLLMKAPPVLLESAAAELELLRLTRP